MCRMKPILTLCIIRCEGSGDGREDGLPCGHVTIGGRPLVVSFDSER